MKGFIEVYDQRTQFLKDIFLSHGYQINDKQSQNLDFYVVKNQKIDHDNTFSLNNINTKYIINKDKVFKHLNHTFLIKHLNPNDDRFVLFHLNPCYFDYKL